TLAKRSNIMAILLQDLQLVTWLWHDAEIRSIDVSYGKDGAVSVRFRCNISPEEDITPLTNLNIHKLLVDTVFLDVFQIRMDVKGYYSQPEVIDRWDIVGSSELIEDIKKTYQNLDLSHHRITFSGGGAFDIVFGEIWLDETSE